MKLNEMAPAAGSTTARKRVGRGIGSGLGKTCGRGHKGQKSRAGGFHKVGFEGGQMPIQRRLPKIGFNSGVGAVSAKVRLGEISAVEGDEVTLDSLRAAGVVSKNTKYVKVFLSGQVDRSLVVKGVRVSKGAKEAIESAGGKVE